MGPDTPFQGVSLSRGSRFTTSLGKKTINKAGPDRTNRSVKQKKEHGLGVLHNRRCIPVLQCSLWMGVQNGTPYINNKLKQLIPQQ